MGEKRNIIRIDEEKCDGCGLCATACAEGAIQIISGKAKLVSETYCDGLGACLGECPQGALTIEEREAAIFDETEVEKHLENLKKKHETPAKKPDAIPHGCPGSAAFSFKPPAAKEKSDQTGRNAGDSQLSNWPVQLKLVPITAPYFDNADLLIAADCVPFAYPDFHGGFLDGKILVIGCPKLDDSESYVEKLSRIFADNDIKSVEVAHMEVPCCFGLVRIVELALNRCGKKIPAKTVKFGIKGALLETVALNY